MDSARKESYRQASSLEAPTGNGAGGEEGRRAGRRHSRTAAPAPSAAPTTPGCGPLIERALASLPEEQREVFLLREYSGIAFKEIAEVTGVSENTVKSRMRYALEGLRRRLAELGVDGDLVEDGRTVAG